MNRQRQSGPPELPLQHQRITFVCFIVEMSLSRKRVFCSNSYPVKITLENYSAYYNALESRCQATKQNHAGKLDEKRNEYNFAHQLVIIAQKYILFQHSYIQLAFDVP